MERNRNIFGWSEELVDLRPKVTYKVSVQKSATSQPQPLPIRETDEFTFKQIINEIFGWPLSVMNLVDEAENETNPEPDDSEWYNNEDPEAAEEPVRKTETGTTQGDTSTNNNLTANEEIGGNEAAGAGAAGGTGGGGTSSGGAGGR